VSARQQRLEEAVRLCGRILETPQLRTASVKALATIILDIAHTDLQAEEGGEVSLGKLFIISLWYILTSEGIEGRGNIPGGGLQALQL